MRQREGQNFQNAIFIFLPEVFALDTPVLIAHGASAVLVTQQQEPVQQRGRRRRGPYSLLALLLVSAVGTHTHTHSPANAPAVPFIV